MVTVNSSCCPAGLVWRLARRPERKPRSIRPSFNCWRSFRIRAILVVMSGYEKSEDYGGPPVTWRSYVGGAIGIAFLLFLFLYLQFG